MTNTNKRAKVQPDLVILVTGYGMTLNDSIRYKNGQLFVNSIAVADIVSQVGTPTYIYSLRRALNNFWSIRAAFADFDAHIHYSAKANANLSILKALIEAGAGIDCVSGGEIFRALKAGAKASDIVYAGVGKTGNEILYALEQGVGWFNVENVDELHIINQIAGNLGRDNIQIALRLNPDVTANTHPYIATGHGGAKFGLTAEAIRHVLHEQHHFNKLTFKGLHVHIGSQLGDTNGTVEAVEKALELIAPYEHMKTLNIGGGIPAQYQADAELPSAEDFAKAVKPLVQGYEILLEPGRSIIADAGILVGEVLYTKQQAGQNLAIISASMTELIRPALYQATHDIVPLIRSDADLQATQVVGPVCETSDVLGRDVMLPLLQTGDGVALLTAGAYGSVMASNYNARPRPAEVVVTADGESWFVARERESWSDLIAHEVLE